MKKKESEGLSKREIQTRNKESGEIETMTSQGEEKASPQEYLKYKHAQTRQAAVKKAGYSATASEKDLIQWWTEQKNGKIEKAVIALLDILTLKEKENKALRDEIEALKSKNPPCSEKCNPQAAVPASQQEGETNLSASATIPTSPPLPCAGEKPLHAPPYSPMYPALYGAVGHNTKDGEKALMLTEGDQIAHMAPIKIQTRRIRNVDNEGQVTQGFHSETISVYRAFSPLEKQSLLADSPDLKRNHRNTEFWDKLESLEEMYGLHKKDMHILELRDRPWPDMLESRGTEGGKNCTWIWSSVLSVHTERVSCYLVPLFLFFYLYLLCNHF
ncbi:uncharacterized protein LOC142831213 [Pelodiscus sinensis]|uniref:uncharacterized protein LOC142831213 n=1 Tax=Pelodiscus sinensis TaxID=13735 RepID=UPI003F6C8AA5